jgi:hypothetical protein
MNRSSALEIFGLGPDFEPEDLVDALEQLRFDLCQPFLTRIPHPKLIDARIAKLEMYREAAEVLGHREDHFQIPLAAYFPQGGLEPMIRFYDAELARARKELSNARSMSTAMGALRHLSVLQQWWEAAFLHVVLPWSSPGGILAAERPDTAEMLRVLNKYTENELPAQENVTLLLPFLAERERILKKGN